MNKEYTYLGAPSDERIALANKIAGMRPTDFATWARSQRAAFLAVAAAA